MNIFLKNKLSNIILSFICNVVVCVITYILAITAGNLIVLLLSCYIAGGCGLWVNQWFKEKYVHLNSNN